MLPDPVRAAIAATQAGADGITAHLREDRRHISDEDIARLRSDISLPLNLEMAATEGMLRIALDTQPHAVCLVPERREERTTEGGLDVISHEQDLMAYVDVLSDAGMRVSLFIEPDLKQLDMAKKLGAPVVELHTGTYCDATSQSERVRQLARITLAAAHAEEIGLECHAGHGLSFDTVKPVAAIPSIMELNIGHFLIGEAVYTGLEAAIHKMRKLINEARS